MGWFILVSMVVVATSVVSCGLPRATIILVAQVFNGMLLPIFSLCLLLCINDLQLMAGAPQGLVGNCVLLPSVTITVFLAVRVAVQKLAIAFDVDDPHASNRLALPLAVTVMVAIVCMTSLRKDLRRSLIAARGGQEFSNDMKDSSTS